MFLGRVTNWVSVVGTDIPFITELNTNLKTRNTAGEVAILESGLWNIDASLELTGVVGNIVIDLLADGVVRDSRTVTLDLVTDFANVSFADAVRVLLSNFPNIADISMRVDTAGVTVNGKLRVESVR